MKTCLLVGRYNSEAECLSSACLAFMKLNFFSSAAETAGLKGVKLSIVPQRTCFIFNLLESQFSVLDFLLKGHRTWKLKRKLDMLIAILKVSHPFSLPETLVCLSFARWRIPVYLFRNREVQLTSPLMCLSSSKGCNNVPSTYCVCTIVLTTLCHDSILPSFLLDCKLLEGSYH